MNADVEGTEVLQLLVPHSILSGSYFENSHCPFIRRLMFPMLQSLLKYSSSSSHGCIHSLLSYIFLKGKRKMHDAWRNDKNQRPSLSCARLFPSHNESVAVAQLKSVTTETWTTWGGGCWGCWRLGGRIRLLKTKE